MYGVIIDEEKWAKMMKVIARAVIFRNEMTEVDSVIAYCEEQLLKSSERHSDSYIDSARELPSPVPFPKGYDSGSDHK
jgi:hypothetical protein